jgi:hypothetical protein
LKNEATEKLATKAALIENLRAAHVNFEKDISMLEKTIDSDEIEIKILESQVQEQDERSVTLKSRCNAAKTKCLSKLCETEALERQLMGKILSIFENQSSSSVALKGLIEERSARDKNLDALVETLKISELEADLAGNARAETLEQRRLLNELEKKHEIALLEEEKFKMKLPKMEKLLSQKADNFKTANAESAVKILQLQQEGRELQ